MPPADSQPDFDSMSPEELMAWMETLAKSQGATQGFTTDKHAVDEPVNRKRTHSVFSRLSTRLRKRRED